MALPTAKLDDPHRMQWAFKAAGIDKDEIVMNDEGGKQSKIEGLMTEVPPLALKELACVMGAGSVRYPREKDGTPNWYRIDALSNLDHGMLHIANFLQERNKPRSGRKAEVLRDELSHAAARVMMALEQFLRNGKGKIDGTV